MKDNKEIIVHDNKFLLSEDNILYVTLGKEHDEKIAKEMQDAVNKLLDMADGKVNVYADNSWSKRPAPEARMIFKELSEDERLGKIAIFGISPVVRVIASFVTGLSKNKDIRVFKIKEEALAWVKE